jgi:hypothetical protein
MQRQTPPPLPARAQPDRALPGRAVRGLAPLPVQVAPTAAFDVDAGAGGRPRSRTARLKARDHGPAEVRVGDGLLRWDGAELSVRLRSYGGFHRLVLADEPPPPDPSGLRFPQPVAELVLFTQRAGDGDGRRDLFLALLDAQGYRIVLLPVLNPNHGPARTLVATLRARTGLTVNEYHLPVVEGLRRSLGRRLFPPRPLL